MNKIQFKNPDGIYSVTIDGIQYKVEIEHATIFSIQDETRFQIGIIKIDEAGEYVEVLDTLAHAPQVVGQTHVNNFEHGIYDSDCIRWAIFHLTDF